MRIYLEPARDANEQHADDSQPFIMSLQAFATSETRPKHHRADTSDFHHILSEILTLRNYEFLGEAGIMKFQV